MRRSRKRTTRGLTLLALLALGIICWQALNWSEPATHAAAPRASMAALDEAALRYLANPTDANAHRLNDARAVYAKAAAADPSVKAPTAKPKMALSALVQIQALKALKSSLTNTQKKIGSRLRIVSLRQQGKLPVVLESLRTKVETSKEGNAVVDLTVTNLTAGMKSLAPYKFNITSAVGHIIRTEVPFDKLEEIAALPQIVAVKEPSHARTHQATPNPRSRFDNVAARAPKPAPAERAKRLTQRLTAAMAQVSSQNKSAANGSLMNSLIRPRSVTAVNVSEGDRTHRADNARAAFLVNGTGVKIGVISDGVDTLATSQGTGDLGPVTVLPGQAGTGDEGTAMLEIVHDLAPGAQLFFATADPTQAQFAQNIRDLRTAGCDIIVDDIIYLDESPVHDGQLPATLSTLGLIEQAVNDVTADGALYFSSAGNEGNKDDGTSGTWEGDFLASSQPIPPGDLDGVGILHDFGDGGQSDLVNFDSEVNTLHWSDPIGASANDYDIYDCNGSLDTVFDGSFDSQDGDDDPVEIFGVAFAGERLVIAQFAGASRFLSMRAFRGVLDLSTTGSSHGHSQAAAAYSVAATPATTGFGPGEPNGPYPGPFTNANVSETFSSDGPRQLFYKADETLFGAGVLAGQGLIRQKPDVTAADGVSTSAQPAAFFNPFFGTSAAAPHAAAIAALVKSAAPAFTPAQIRTALTSSAIDIEAAGVDRDTGAGIVMAFQAVQATGATGIAILALGTPNFTETGGDSDGFPEPCERLSFTVPVDNVGAATATAVSATLTSSTPGVVITPASSAYPNIPAGGSASNATQFVVTLPCSLACGSTLDLTLTVSYTGGTSPQSFNFSYLLGGPGTPVTVSYVGPPLPIPDGLNLSGNNPGAPVMAPLVVSGVSGRIFDLNFRIDGSACSTTIGSTTVGIDHTYVSDLELKLISPAPGLTTVSVANQAGGAANNGNNFCQTVLDDDTGNPSIQAIIASQAPFTGTFKPNASLTTFRGLDPNGTWNLQAQDFFSGDTGSVRAYSLIITPTDCSTTACSLTCPANITVTAPGPGGAVVNYPEAGVAGGCGVLNYSTPSGSTFPEGTTTVTVTGAGGASCQFTVTVNPPCTITCPADVSQGPDPGQNGAVVTYPAPTAAVSCGTVTCTPASGSFFPSGTTPVSCSTTAGPTCGFNVTVRPPRFWTSAGSTGTFDEDSAGLLQVQDFTTRLLDGKTGTGTVRYNITAVDGISSFCPATQSFVSVRFRNSDDTGAHAQVKFEIHRTNIATGGNDIIFTFNSNGIGNGLSFTTASLTPNIDFDFSNYVYWIEATIFRDSAAQAADLGSIQISESTGTPCP